MNLVNDISSELPAEVLVNAENAALRLNDYLSKTHLRDDGGLVGPDPGVRWNLRIGRFVKSYLPFINWNDSSYLLQGQGYWILANQALHRLRGEDQYKSAALRCADIIVTKQTDAGYWLYDNAAWAGRIASVEGCFASLGLLAAYQMSGYGKYIDAAKKWHSYMLTGMGFQRTGPESLALNYFANANTGPVPNNSTLGLWFMAQMSKVTGDKNCLVNTRELINFLKDSQLESGEFPYEFGNEEKPDRIHYLCYQYHGFQFLDLAEYYGLTEDDSVVPLLEKTARFLATGVTPAGDARYCCGKDRPIVHYYTAAVAAALLKADKMGLGNYMNLALKMYARLLTWQKPTGSFDFSAHNYLVFADKRSYPRAQTMILKHLLLACELYQGSK